MYVHFYTNFSTILQVKNYARWGLMDRKSLMFSMSFGSTFFKTSWCCEPRLFSRNCKIRLMNSFKLMLWTGSLLLHKSWYRYCSAVRGWKSIDCGVTKSFKWYFSQSPSFDSLISSSISIHCEAIAWKLDKTDTNPVLNKLERPKMCTFLIFGSKRSLKSDNQI